MCAARRFSCPSFFHPSTNRRMYKLLSSGLIRAPCGVPRPRPRKSVRVPTPPPSVPRDLGSRAPLTVSVSRLAWVYTLAVPAAVDTFYFSALAPVRPTTSALHTLRCPRRSGHLLLLLRHWLCSIRRRTPEHLLGTPCRREHRSENWTIPSLCRATPSATSEHSVELLGSSPIPRSFVASCVSFQLRLLPSTGITRLRRYCAPRREPTRPGLSHTTCHSIPPAITVGTSRVAHGPLCLHAI